MSFYYFTIISPRKRVWTFILTNLNPWSQHTLYMYMDLWGQSLHLEIGNIIVNTTKMEIHQEFSPFRVFEFIFLWILSQVNKPICRISHGWIKSYPSATLHVRVCFVTISMMCHCCYYIFTFPTICLSWMPHTKFINDIMLINTNRS